MTTINSNNYPFASKASIKDRLDNDSEFRIKAMKILLALQTESEQNTESTIVRNRQGFMSSHAVHGTRVAKKIQAGQDLTAEDMMHVNAIAPRYSRQLAVFFRAEDLRKNPSLAAAAAVFSGASTK